MNRFLTILLLIGLPWFIIFCGAAKGLAVAYVLASGAFILILFMLPKPKPPVQGPKREKAQSFTITDDGLGITCHACGFTSYNLNDVKHHYCDYCHKFHDDP